MNAFKKFLKKRLLQGFLVSLAIFTSIFILQKILELYSLKIENNVPTFLFIKEILFSLPFTLAITSLISIPFAVQWAYSGKIVGIIELLLKHKKYGTLLKPLVSFSLVISLLSFVLINILMPVTNEKYKSLYKRMVSYPNGQMHNNDKNLREIGLLSKVVRYKFEKSKNESRQNETLFEIEKAIVIPASHFFTAIASLLLSLVILGMKTTGSFLRSFWVASIFAVINYVLLGIAERTVINGIAWGGLLPLVIPLAIFITIFALSEVLKYFSSRNRIQTGQIILYSPSVYFYTGFFFGPVAAYFCFLRFNAINSKKIGQIILDSLPMFLCVGLVCAFSFFLTENNSIHIVKRVYPLLGSFGGIAYEIYCRNINKTHRITTFTIDKKEFLKIFIFSLGGMGVYWVLFFILETCKI